MTGGTGFLGSYLLRYLVAQGYTRIRALRQPSSSTDLVEGIADKIEWVEGNILDVVGLEDALKGVQQVYHCAAIISFDAQERANMMEVNSTGTANIVNAALSAKVEKFIHVSSIAAIGRTKENKIITEENKWLRSSYNSHYAISKYLAEQEVWRGMAEGLAVGIVNPSLMLGAGRWTDGPLRLFNLVWKNYPFYTTGTTGFVDVRDVARFMIHLMESPITGQRYILNAENNTFQFVMNEIALHLHKKKPTIQVRPWMQQIIWRVDWLRAKLWGARPLITRETAANALQFFLYKNDKSLQVFDFQYTPLEQTIRETCAQFLETVHSKLPPRGLPLI